MNDDPSNNGQASKSWIDRLSQAFSSEPRTPKTCCECCALRNSSN